MLTAYGFIVLEEEVVEEEEPTVKEIVDEGQQHCLRKMEGAMDRVNHRPVLQCTTANLDLSVSLYIEWCRSAHSLRRSAELHTS